MNKKKTESNFIKAEELKLKKGWSLGIDRHPPKKKLSDVIDKQFKTK